MDFNKSYSGLSDGSTPLIDLTIFKELEIRYKNSPELEQIDSPSRVSDLAQILIGDCSEIRFLGLLLWLRARWMRRLFPAGTGPVGRWCPV